MVEEVMGEEGGGGGELGLDGWNGVGVVDGVGEMVYGGVEEVVGVCKRVYRGVELVGVGGDGEEFVERWEREGVEEWGDRFEKGRGYVFEEVWGEDIVEYWGYGIENGVYE